MDKLEYRAVIKFFVLDGLTPKEIHPKLTKVYGDSAPSMSTVKKWAAEFKRGRTSLEDDPREGRPKTATTPETIEKVHDIVLDDRRVKVSEIAEAVGISEERVRNILHNQLGMRKLCARWVPHLLTTDQKQMRKRLSQQSLDRFNRDPTDFVRRFVTMDETWVHHYTPETKQQSKQWVEVGGSAPKKAKSIASAGKVMASVFWDAKGILLIDYLAKGRTITGEYYSNLLDQLDTKIREKRPGLKKKKIIFHQDNAPVHKGALAMGKLRDLRYDLLDHPPYSPDLAPSDFHLFPNLKKFVSGKRFASNEEVERAVDEYFHNLPDSHFREGILMLEKRWIKCVELKGDYVEK